MREKEGRGGAQLAPAPAAADRLYPWVIELPNPPIVRAYTVTHVHGHPHQQPEAEVRHHQQLCRRRC